MDYTTYINQCTDTDVHTKIETERHPSHYPFPLPHRSQPVTLSLNLLTFPNVLHITKFEQIITINKIIMQCQKWDSNPRLQWRLRPERSTLDRSAIRTKFIIPLRINQHETNLIECAVWLAQLHGLHYLRKLMHRHGRANTQIETEKHPSHFPFLLPQSSQPVTLSLNLLTFSKCSPYYKV